MRIQFVAALQGASCIKIDDDNSANIKLTVDGSEIANVVKLLTLQGRAFTVTVETKP